MASVVTVVGNLAPTFRSDRKFSNSLRSRLCGFQNPITANNSNRTVAVRGRVRIRAVMETMPEVVASSTADEKKLDQLDDDQSSSNILGCPICHQVLTWSCGDSANLSIESAQGTTLQCNSCKKAYYANEAHFDLTVTGAATDYVESMPLATEFFTTDWMSRLYERGWRQNFGLGGYPGAQKEFEMAKQYLEPVMGGKIIDASCGSGLFSRLFAKSGLFSRVVALDYSDNMLKQCYEFVTAEQDDSFPKQKLILVRADIARLPFVSASIDAVHAGAALHCWPSPVAAVAEISRVLRPGGVFVATTTVADGPLLFPLLPLLKPLRENLLQFAGSRIFLSETELQDLCQICGLVNFTCQRNGPFILMSASKPRRYVPSN